MTVYQVFAVIICLMILATIFIKNKEKTYESHISPDEGFKSEFDEEYKKLMRKINENHMDAILDHWEQKNDFKYESLEEPSESVQLEDLQPPHVNST